MKMENGKLKVENGKLKIKGEMRRCAHFFLYIFTKVFEDCQGTFFKKSLNRGEGRSPDVFSRCSKTKAVRIVN